MRKIKINVKYIILGVAAGLSGFTLAQLQKYRKILSGLEQMYEITQQSYTITSVNIAKLQSLDDEIKMLQYVENQAVADSLKASLIHKQDSIAHATLELTNKNEQRIQQIAQQNNIKIK